MTLDAELAMLRSIGLTALQLLALDRVEAEIARLTAERDEAVRDIHVVHAQGQEVAATAVRHAVARLERKLKSAEAERDAIGAALGEPCAECGHIDWRSDGYADRFLAGAEAAAKGWRELLSEATKRAEAAEARVARLREGHFQPWEIQRLRDELNAKSQEVARLRELLREAQSLLRSHDRGLAHWHDLVDEWNRQARALLAEDGAA